MIMLKIMGKVLLLLIGIFFLCVAMMCDGEGKPVYTYVTNKTDEIIYVQKTYSGAQIEDAFRLAFQEVYPDSTVPIETYYVYESDSPEDFAAAGFANILTMKSLKTNLWISGVPTAIKN